MTHGLGLLPPDGRHDEAVAAMSRPMCAATDAEIPDDVDASDSLTVNDQGPFNSCDGNATDKALERDVFLATGEKKNFSARFSYLAARVIDGTNDQPDGGATIEGGAVAAHKMGRVLESEFPYWDYQNGEGFDPTLPPHILQLGLQNCAQSIVRMPSMEACLRFLGTGQGAIVYGMWWTEELMNYGGGSAPISHSFGTSTVGGHALCMAGYHTVDGEKCPETWNSHGVRWGNQGRMIVRPNLMWQAIQAAPWGAWGISCGSSFTKKPFPGFLGVF